MDGAARLNREVANALITKDARKAQAHAPSPDMILSLSVLCLIAFAQAWAQKAPPVVQGLALVQEIASPPNAPDHIWSDV